MAYYFQQAFGVAGDKTAIPVGSQVDGSISYNQGYGPDYAAPRDTDPAALPIEREKFNQLLYAITSNIQQYQQHGVPEFITTADNGGIAFQYDKNAIVRYDNGTSIENYISKINSNATLPTNATNWGLLRSDAAYLGVAQTFTAIQTFGAAGTPIVINSTNSTGLKVTFQDNAVARGGIGATSAWTSANYLADLATIAGGWDTSGNLAPGAAATYDLGTASLGWRNAIANRFTVLGNTLPTNGLYLPAANTVGIAANSLHSASFTSTGMNDTPIGASTAAAGTFLAAVANSFVPNSSTIPVNGLYLPAANTLGWAINSAAKVQLNAGALSPAVSDGAALGTTALMWSDLFLASGGVINFNNGDVTITHSADVLAFAGAATNYSFAGGPIVPSANDGLALGTSALSFSDLFLAAGGVINFNNGNATITHSTGILTSSVQIIAPSIGFNSTGGIIGTTTNNNASAGSVGEFISVVTPSNANTSTVTITLASPGVITWNAHPFSTGGAQAVVFTTTGALPTGLTAGTTYYVVPSSVTTNTFTVATTAANALAGTAINTSGGQSGTQTCTSAAVLATGIDKDIAAITLTAGDWDLHATVVIKPAGGATPTAIFGWTSVTSATLPSFPNNGAIVALQGTLATNGTQSMPTGIQRVSVPSPTNYYLSCEAGFPSGSCVGYGIISARRSR